MDTTNLMIIAILSFLVALFSIGNVRENWVVFSLSLFLCVLSVAAIGYRYLGGL